MESNHKFAQDSEIGSVVEPMVWVYIEDIDRLMIIAIIISMIIFRQQLPEKNHNKQMQHI